MKKKETTMTKTYIIYLIDSTCRGITWLAYVISHMKSLKSIPPLISCQTLRDILRSPPKKISLLEADIGKQFEKDFQHAHIPQARYFDQLECTTPTKYIPRGLPEIKCFESYFSRLGVSNDDHIILYDRSPMGLYASSRAWWLLKTLGIDSLSILDGGFFKWLKEIKDAETSETKTETGKFVVHLNEKMIKNYDAMLQIISTKNTNEQIVDARPPNIFNGSKAGHLPNSLNLPYTEVFDQTNQSLKSKDELKKLFNNAKVDLSKSTIYTCQTGTTASTLAFIGHILGQKSLSVYNGSFGEWQQRAPKELIISDNTNNAAA